jgi:hypothetical protein
MKKDTSYLNLLKDALLEYDTSVMTYMGPLTKPVVGFDGDQKKEIETHKTYKDAASAVLERYYAAERLKEKGVRINMLGEDAQEQKPEQNEIKTGETPDNPATTVDQVAKTELDGEKGAFEPTDNGIVTNEELTLVEKEIINRLIKEMEEIAEAEENPVGKDEGTEQAGTDLSDEGTIDSLLGSDDIADTIAEALLYEDGDIDDLILETILMEEDEDASEKNMGSGGDEKGTVLDVDDKVKDGEDEPINEGRGLGPIWIAKDELKKYKTFREQLEMELLDEDIDLDLLIEALILNESNVLDEGDTISDNALLEALLMEDEDNDADDKPEDKSDSDGDDGELTNEELDLLESILYEDEEGEADSTDDEDKPKEDSGDDAEISKEDLALIEAILNTKDGGLLLEALLLSEDAQEEEAGRNELPTGGEGGQQSVDKSMDELKDELLELLLFEGDDDTPEDGSSADDNLPEPQDDNKDSDVEKLADALLLGENAELLEALLAEDDDNADDDAPKDDAPEADDDSKIEKLADALLLYEDEGLFENEDLLEELLADDLDYEN